MPEADGSFLRIYESLQRAVRLISGPRASRQTIVTTPRNLVQFPVKPQLNGAPFPSRRVCFLCSRGFSRVFAVPRQLELNPARPPPEILSRQAPPIVPRRSYPTAVASVFRCGKYGLNKFEFAWIIHWTNLISRLLLMFRLRQERQRRDIEGISRVEHRRPSFLTCLALPRALAEENRGWFSLFLNAFQLTARCSRHASSHLERERSIYSPGHDLVTVIPLHKRNYIRYASIRLNNFLDVARIARASAR